MNWRKLLEEDGISCIWVVITLPILIAFLGFAIDIGYMVWVGQQLQAAADAAALAAVPHVRHDIPQARLTALELGSANPAANQPVQLDPNDANAAEGDVVVGRYDRESRVFTPQLTACNAVKVVARRTGGSLGGPVPLLFGPAIGHNAADISRTAIAMLSGGTGAGLIVLDKTARNALEVFGDVTLQVDGGAIMVNSSDSQAAYFGGNINMDAAAVDIVGDVRVVGQPGIPPVNYVDEPKEDPLAGVPAPTWDPAADLGTVNVGGGETVNLVPGFYSGGITINNGVLNLSPGIYVLDGEGLRILGGDFYAPGCMFYVMGTGSVYIGGNGIVNITPPDPDLYTYPGVDVYEGIAIFQARDNTNEGTIIGTSVMDLEGTYYFPSNHMNLGGNATKFGNQLILNTATISGNGTLIINYEGSDFAPGSRPYLVF